MLLIKQSEATAALRRIPIYLVDATDGFTPETGVTTPTIDISKNGAIQSTGGGSWSEIGDGLYYYTATASEIDTLGFLNVRVIKSGVSREFAGIAQIVAFNPYVALALESTSQSLDTKIDAIQADLDDPDQFKADVSALSLEATSQSILADLLVVKKIETGRWKIFNNQMVFYDDDEVTPLFTFNLLNAAGDPTSVDVMERIEAP